MYNVAGLLFTEKEEGEPEHYLRGLTKVGLMDGDYDKVGWNSAEYCQLMQSTGLFDRNGVEIFEGDLVVDTSYSTPRTYAIEWQDSSCGFEPFSDSVRNCGHCGNGINPKDCEVVGNIYQHPHLLQANPKSL